MLRGRVSAVNGVPSEQVEVDPKVAWVLRGDRGITWSASRPANAKVVEGEWWPDDYAGDPLISLDVETARGLGLKIGDTLTVNILGRDITGKLANFREIDWALHTQNTPLTITLLQAQCPAGGGGPCGREEHCEGQITSQAVWDFWNRDLTAAPFNYTLDRSREIATLLSFRGSGSVTSWYSCSQGSGGCAATTGYMGYLAADDDNGNLNDGTPHMTALHTAFNRHGIACATPTPGWRASSVGGIRVNW